MADQKLVFAVPEELHTAIKDAAARDERSMASWIRIQLQAALERVEPRST